jgi:hypothetical protein
MATRRRELSPMRRLLCRRARRWVPPNMPKRSWLVHAPRWCGQKGGQVKRTIFFLAGEPEIRLRPFHLFHIGGQCNGPCVEAVEFLACGVDEVGHRGSLLGNRIEIIERGLGGLSELFPESQIIRTREVRCLLENCVFYILRMYEFLHWVGQKRPYGHVGSNVRFARKQSSSGHR